MKLTYEDKVKIAKDYKKLGSNLTAKKWKISRRYVTTLNNKYKNNCLNKHSKNNKYTLEFKLDLITAYVQGEGSFESLANKFGVKSKSIIEYWYNIYQSYGVEGLINMKKTGRPQKNKNKDNKKKLDLDKLLSKDKEDYTKEEIKTLKEELLRLRCQEEFSKKFEALAQDYLKKKNSN